MPANSAAREAARPALDVPPAKGCPNCEAGVMEVFYQARNIPVHSVLLMPSRQRAVDYPRRDLQLGFCPKCGFIANTVFDSAVHEYGTSCEETQGFSPTFNTFARELARRWMEKYGLRGKTVLEIGCGKGDFLVQLAELGLGKGIGIDPAFVPERLNTPAASRLQFIQDLYSEKYAALKADAICCRHTLEHIAPTARFMRLIRRTLDGQSEPRLLFELPDASRILREGAFWDIYYEHCSYFTTGSLARLFRQTGFDPLELEVEYDGQYIVIAGRPSTMDASASPRLPGEGDLEEITRSVARFPTRFQEVRTHWMDTIDSARHSGKRIVLWGGGSKAVAFVSALGLGNQIECVVDINPFKQGKFIPGSGHRVVGPAGLLEIRPDVVILMNPIYEAEVRSRLGRLGLNPAILPLRAWSTN